jgi:hypothetical protein
MSTLDFEESGFQVSAPAPAFRFSDLKTYRAASGRELKEMDVCWLDTSAFPARLLVLELKGLDVWSTPPDDPLRPHEHLVRTCIQKANDTLLMFAGAWLSTGWGQALAQEMPPAFTPPPKGTRLHLVFLIDIPETRRELLLPVREEINGRLQGRLGVFDLQRVSVIDFESARKMGLPVTRP